MLLLQFLTRRAAATFGRALPASGINQDAAHRLCGSREEVCSVLKLRISVSDEFDPINRVDPEGLSITVDELNFGSFGSESGSPPQGRSPGTKRGIPGDELNFGDFGKDKGKQTDPCETKKKQKKPDPEHEKLKRQMEQLQKQQQEMQRQMQELRKEIQQLRQNRSGVHPVHTQPRGAFE